MSTPLDTPWKEILEAYFPQFLAFFFPEIDRQVDWTKGFSFLDTELQQLTIEGDTGKRILDKLAKVQLHSGKQQWILIHIEIQNQKEDRFTQRVYTYHARLRDKYPHYPVASLAVLGDTSREWRPQVFQEEFLGCEIRFSFPIVKLLDYKQRQQELEASDNPFAFVVQAHLAAQATKAQTSQQRRQAQKFALTTKLYEKGYNRQEIIDLFRFLDWVMTLPPALEADFRTNLKTYEAEKHMTYITSIERLSKAEGKAEGKAELLVRLLQRKLGTIEPTTITTITTLPLEQIEQLAEDLLDFQVPQDLTDWLQNYHN
jgi:hypothetical protein